MLNRRLVRIKALQALFSQIGQKPIEIKAIRNLFIHLTEKIKAGYLIQFNLLVELRHRAVRELENESSKFNPTQDRIDWLTQFIQHPLLLNLSESKLLETQCQKYGAIWNHNLDHIHSLLEEIKSKDVFSEVLLHAQKNVDDQRKDLLALCRYFIQNSPVFQSLMEEWFMGWQDDLPVITAQVGKTIKQMDGTHIIPFYTLDKVDIQKLQSTEIPDDTFAFWQHNAEEWLDLEAFGVQLCEQALIHLEEHDGLISSKIKNWDMDRIAQSDYVLLHMALTEFQCFETIPPKVTINEYLDLAKIYSSPNSSQFLNGILDNLRKEMQEAGKITKSGRGLLQ